MRIGEPVTQREFEFPDHATLMSTKDTHSRIAYANAAFVGPGQHHAAKCGAGGAERGRVGGAEAAGGAPRRGGGRVPLDAGSIIL